MRAYRYAPLLLLLGACQPAPRPGTAPAAAASVDSIVVERTRCYGTCPAYRVSVSADGRVAFTSRYPDEGRTEAGRVAPEAFRRLVAEVATSGFAALPDTIAGHADLCPAPSTDSPSAMLGVFGARGAKQVVDDRGCAARPGAAAARLAALRALTARVDTVAGTPAWVRPVRR